MNKALLAASQENGGDELAFIILGILLDVVIAFRF